MDNETEGLKQNTSHWLQTRLDDYLVLAEPLSGCIGLLNPMAAWVLEAKAAGLAGAEIASNLAAQFGIDVLSAQKDVERIVTMQAGLLQQARNPQPREKRPSPENAGPVLFQAAHTLQLKLGLQVVRFEAQSTELFELLKPCIGHLNCNNPQTSQLLQLRGSEDYWQVVLNHQVLADGSGSDGAVCHTISEMVQLGCEPDDRQMVVHGAGICTDTHGVLLIGPGGCGKTTLAVALNASGFDLINDDVVAVSRKGQLSSACMSMCLKQGSWSLLASRLPVIDALQTFTRYGQLVRYLPPCGKPPGLPVNTSVFIFPSFCESGRNSVEKLAPWQVLQGVVEAESFIPDLDQQRLDDLANWVASAPGYRVQYGDIDSGVEVVSELIMRETAL